MLVGNEFMEYWRKLDLEEKQSLLTVAKNYIPLKAEGNNTDVLRNKIIQRERETYLKGGRIFLQLGGFKSDGSPHDDVKLIIKNGIVK